MTTHRLFYLLIILVITTTTGITAQILDETVRRNVVAGERLLYFEHLGEVHYAEDGRTATDVLFTTGSGGTDVLLRRTGLSYIFRRELHPHTGSLDQKIPDSLTLYRVDVEFIGARQNVQPIGEIEEFQRRYYLPEVHGVARGFARVVYHNIYPSIDLIFHVADGRMKYDLVVRPGGDPRMIRMRYSGATSMNVEVATKGIRVTTPFGIIDEGAPQCFLRRGGESGGVIGEEIDSRYRIQGNEISFDVAKYDGRSTLVIDPTLSWATYFGGGGSEEISRASWSRWTSTNEGDTTGDFLIAGRTLSTTIPGYPGTPLSVPGSGNAYITKIRGSDGVPLWTSILGGTADETCMGVAADSNGNSYICGSTGSNNIPTTAGAFQTTSGGGGSEIYVAKFDMSGTLVWCTYYGGTANDYANDITVDANQDIILFGTSESAGLATAGTYKSALVGTAFDHIVVKFSPTGGRLWGTYYGGNVGAETKNWGKVAVDANRNIYFTGGGIATDFPVTAGAFQTIRTGGVGDADVFLVKLDANGNRLWATFISGSKDDDPYGVAVDRSGGVYVVGITWSGNFPVTAGAFQTTLADPLASNFYDSFVAAFDSTGARRWITYYGGINSEEFKGVAINSRREVIVAGGATSTVFPVTTNAWQSTNGGLDDFVVVKFDSNGTRLYATYYGGIGYESANALLAGKTSFIAAGFANTTFLVTANAAQSISGGSRDGAIAKFCDLPVVRVEAIGSRNLCAGDSVVLRAPAGYAYRWSTGATTQSITVRDSGRYSLSVDAGNCSVLSDTVQVIVRPLPRPRLTPSGIVMICPGDSVILDAGVWPSVRWSTGAISRRITVKNIGTYSALVTDTNGCSARSDTFTLGYYAKPLPLIQPTGPLFPCFGDSLLLDGGPGYAAWRWTTGATTRTIVVKNSGRYGVAVRSLDGCWSDTVKSDVTLRQQTPLDWTTNQGADICEGDSFVVVLSGRFLAWGWSTGDTTPRVVIRKGGLLRGWGVDSNGCKSSVAFDVVVSPTPRPVITSDRGNRFCQGDSTTLDAGSGYASYLWSDGSRDRIVVVRTSGRYSVTVWSQAGCEGASPGVDVVVDERPLADISGSVIVCRGAVSVYSLPDAPNLRYTWSVSGSGTSASRLDSNSFAVRWGNIGTGTVRVVVRDAASNCATDTSILVRIQDSLQPRITGNRPPRLCPGGSIELDAGAYASYRWSTGDTSRRITLTSPGTVTVRVVESGGCAGTSAPFVVTTAPPVTPVVSTPNGRILCQGGHLILDAGGVYRSYTWSNGATGRTIVVADTGEYTVGVVDSNGCDGLSEIVRIDRDLPFIASISGPRVVCRNSSSGYLTSPRSGHRYGWSVDGGTISSKKGGEEITVVWGAADSGRVWLTDTSAAGCVESTSIAIRLSDHLEPSVAVTGSLALCDGDSLGLDAGPGYTDYSWSTGEVGRSIVVRTSGSYVVTVHDSSGCSGLSQPVTVTTVALPIVMVDPPGPIVLCDGDSILLRGTPGLRDYRWSNGATGDSLLVRSSGSYQLSAANAEGCRASSGGVSVLILPQLPIPLITRRNDTLFSSVVDGNQWLFNDSIIPGSTSPTLVSRGSGAYRVTVTDINGCTATSDPFELNNSWRLHLDTVNGNVGDPLKLTMRVTPPLLASDGITGYDVTLHTDPRSLYMLRSLAGNPSGVVPRLQRDADGTIHLALADGQPLVGPVLFQLETYGLLTATPRTDVTVESASLNPGGRVPASDGMVLLRGCELGRGTSFSRPVGITRVEVTRSGETLRIIYHAPSQSEPTLRLVDGVGRQVMMWHLPRATGEEEISEFAIGDLSTGLYYIEVRDRVERSVLPIVVVQ